MGLTTVWMIFACALVVLVPLKICAAFFTIAFVESAVYLIIFGAAIAAIMTSFCFLKTHIKNIRIRKNFLIGFLSLLISAGFFWCISGYFNDTSKYDFEWQPLLMSVFSILSCVTFVLIAITYFSGKNILSHAPFFIFCPVLWFALDMVLFLSIYNNSADIYDVVLTALLALFLIYYTQVFANSSNYNVVKLLFIFGIPGIILSLVKCIPMLVKFLNGTNVSAVSASTCTVELLLALYIFATLIECYRQSEKSQEPVIKSVSIK